MFGFLKLLSPAHWYFIAGVALVSAIGAGVGGYMLAHRFDAAPLAEANQATADCNAAREKDNAEQNAKTAQALANSLGQLRDLESKLAALAAERDADTRALMEMLAHVPHTQACAASPAMRIYLDRLRKQAAAVPNAH